MPFSDFLDYKLLDLAKFDITVLDLVLIGLILLITSIFLKYSTAFITKPNKFRRLDKGRKKSMALIFKYFVWVVALSFCLQVIGIQLTWLMAGSAALLVGLGIGIQQIFNDLVSGVFLLFEGTVEVDDILEVDDMVCRVRSINLRTSKVVTQDDVVKIVPNHKFITETVTNWTKQETKHARFRTVIGVSYNSDPEEIRSILLEALQGHPEIYRSEKCEPFVRFMDFADSSINFELVFWSTSIFTIKNVMSDLRYTIFKTFRARNIEIPFPQRDLHIKTQLPIERVKDNEEIR